MENQNFIINLMVGHSISHDLFIYCLVIAFGMVLGSIKFLGVRLGVAGVLFSGLLFAHFGLVVNSEILEFTRELGLIFFVYTIGLQVGPGFFASFKKHGIKLNILAAAIVLLGALVTVLLILTNTLPTTAAVGLFSGATTNTPSLGAAQEALKLVPGISMEQLKMPGLAYAMAYPFGIIGIILSMLVIKALFKIDTQKETLDFANQGAGTAKLQSLDIQIENKNVDGVYIKDIPFLHNTGVAITRVFHNEEVFVARNETKIYVDDIVHAVGTKDKLKELAMILGSASAINLKSDVFSSVVSRKMTVTKTDRVGKTIEEVCLSSFSDITVSRIVRAGVEFIPNRGLTLQLADRLTVVGCEESLNKLADILGDSQKDLDVPLITPLFLGIALGIFIGKIPFTIPGVPASVKLGLAGGPLLVAIILSRIGRIGPLIWYMPRGANYMLREVGITLFLACVGLRSGDQFVNTLINGNGLQWMGWGGCITLIPLLIVSFVARKFLKLNYLSICGLLAGSMTDPPALAFANSQAKSSATSIAYATVYPLVMILRVVSAQLLVIFFMR